MFVQLFFLPLCVAHLCINQCLNDRKKNTANCTLSRIIFANNNSQSIQLYISCIYLINITYP